MSKIKLRVLKGVKQMKKTREFFRKNCKLLSLGCAAVFLSLTAAFSSAFLIPEERNVGEIQTLQADSEVTNGNWSESSTAFATKDANGNTLGLVESKPILINSAEEFAYLVDYAKNLNATEFKYYKLTNPIDLSAHYWYPIGDNSVFNGQLDCDFNPITGLNLDTAQTTIVDTYGIFGVSDELVIKNAIISNAKITVREKIGAAGIVLGTLNHSSGKIEMINSSVSGAITHMGASPSRRDGIGALVGSIVDSGASNKLENVSVNVSIEAANRSSIHGIGTIVGCSSKSINVSNSYFNTSVKISGDKTARTNKYYVGNFGGDSTSDWFYIDGVNNGLPVLNSHYWIGGQITCTGAQITSKLKNNGFTETTAGELVQNVKAYNISSSYIVSNNSTRSGFGVSTATRTGLNQAIEGEIVKLSTTNPAGYSFVDYIVNGANTTEESFEMPAKDTTVVANFEPNRYTLTLNVNGGKISLSTAIVEYDAPKTLPQATKSGCTLTGWWTSQTGGTKVFDGEGKLIAAVDGFSDGNGKWTRSSGVTLYAHWMENKAFILRAWKNSLATQTGVSNFWTLIKTINFTTTKPTSGTAYSVGATTAGTTNSGPQTAHGGTSEVCFDVTAYVTGNSATGYAVTLYSPYVIYAPVDSSSLFSGFNKLTSINFGNFSTIYTKYMSVMFSSCSSLTSLNLSSFNTSNVTNMWNMFINCSKLISLNLSSFDTSNVTAMDGMFSKCTSISSLDLSSFDTSRTESMSGMFINCSSLESLNISSFDTSNVVNMGQMFIGCSNLAALDLSNFNTSNVQGMDEMFAECYKLKSLNVSSFTATNLLTVYRMFYYCNSLEKVDLSGFTTSKIKGTESMFEKCFALKEVNISNLKTSVASTIRYMFAYCSSLESVDLRSWDLSNVVDMEYMFVGCSSLTSVAFKTFNGEYLTSTAGMFESCTSLKVLDLSAFKNTFNLVNSAHMFANCDNLEVIDMRNFSFDHITDSPLFSECLNLKVLISPANCKTEMTLNGQFYDSTGSVYTSVPIGAQSLDLRVAVNVSFKAEYQGHTATVDPIKARYGSNYGEISSLPIPTLTNYIFLGWSYNGEMITNNSIVEMVEDHELISSWQMSECAAFLNSNWQTMISSRGYNFESIRYLKFTYTEPAKDKSADVVDVGAVDQGTEDGSGTMSSSDNVQAYIYKNEDSSGSTVYDVIVYSPYTIYAPVFSKSLFDCYQGTTIDLENFNTSFVVIADCMFRNCPNLTTLDLSGFNTSQVHSMYAMFEEDSSLTSLDLSSFDTSNTLVMDSMFNGCSLLRELDLSSFDMSKCEDFSDRTGLSDLKRLYVFKTPRKANFEIALNNSWIYVNENGTRVGSIPAGADKSFDIRRSIRVALNYTLGEQAGNVVYSKWIRYGEKVGLSTSLPTPEIDNGGIFMGWYTAEQGNENSIEQIRITDETIYDRTINKYLSDGVAKLDVYDWYVYSGEKFTLIFDDKMGNSIEREVISGQPYGTLPVPAATGFEFLGWFDRGQNVKISENDIMSNKMDVLFAHWSSYPRKSSITMYLNNGTIVNMNNITVEGNYAYATGNVGATFTYPTPDRNNYTFDGWFTDLAYTNRYDTSSNTYPSSDITLYAKWANTVMVEFDAQDGISGCKYKEFIIGNKYALGALGTQYDTAYKRGGYKCIGWNTKPDGSGDFVRSGDEVKGDITKLYAIYEKSADEFISQFVNGYVEIRLFDTIEGGMDKPIRVNSNYINFTFKFGDFETVAQLVFSDSDNQTEIVGKGLNPGQRFYALAYFEELVAAAKLSLFEVLYEGKFVGYGLLVDPISIDNNEETKDNQPQFTILDFYESKDEKYEGYIAIRGYIFTNPEFNVSLKCDTSYKIIGGFDWKTYLENNLFNEKFVVRKINAIKTNSDGTETLVSVDSAYSGEYVELILEAVKSLEYFEYFKDLFRVRQILIEV